MGASLAVGTCPRSRSAEPLDEALEHSDFTSSHEVQGVSIEMNPSSAGGL